MKEERPYRRHIFIIKRTLQFKFVAIVCLAMILTAIAVGWDIYYTTMAMVSEQASPAVARMVANINHIIFAKLLIMIIIIGIVSIFLSHRVAGPVYRFEKSAEVLATGDLTYRVFLRKGDELFDLRDALNRMIEQLQAKLIGDRKHIRQITSRLETLSNQLQDTSLKEKVKTISSEVENLTSGFKV